MDKVSGKKSGKIGAAWKNANGSISLVMQVGTSLIYDKDLVITLFPHDEKGDDVQEPEKE